MKITNVEGYAKKKKITGSRVRQMIIEGKLKNQKIGNQNFIIESEPKDENIEIKITKTGIEIREKNNEKSNIKPDTTR